MEKWYDVDAMKVVYHFSTAHNKTMLCPHRHERQNLCQFTPAAAQGTYVYRDDIPNTRGLRSLKQNKCVFIHDEELADEFLCELAEQSEMLLPCLAVPGLGTIHSFDPRSFNRRRY